MIPPGRSGPSRQQDDRKRQAPRMDGKRANRCFRDPPVLIPPKEHSVFLTHIPIAPAVPSDAAYPEPLVAPSSVQASHQVQPLAFSVGNPHPALLQRSGNVNVVAQNGVPPNAGLPSFPHIVSTPQIFTPSKLRSGKWHLAEEKYADLLIDLFNRGLTVECENGATLRSFLSRKLHCSPMRISKKYAGKGIGKKVFLSKRNNLGLQPISSEDTRDAMAKLKLAEAKFYNSLFPGSNMNHLQVEARMTGPPAFLPRLAPFPPLPTQPHAIVPPPQVKGIRSGHGSVMPSPPPQTSFAQVGGFVDRNPGPRKKSGQSAISQVGNTALVVQPTTVLQRQCVAEAVTLRVLRVQGPKGVANAGEASVRAPLVASPGIIATTTESPDDTHAAKLHESYVRALNDMEEATKKREESNLAPLHLHRHAVAANSQTVSTKKKVGSMIRRMPPVQYPAPPESKKDIKTHLETIAVPVGKATQSIPIASNKSDQAHPSGIHMTEPSTSTSVLSTETIHTNSKRLELLAPSASDSSDLKLSDDPDAVRENQQSKQSIQPASRDFAELRPTLSDTLELPDLLAGFDNASRLVSEQDQSYLSSVQTRVADGAYQHSPPFTSRSFDDFHCLLGKDLAPLSGELEATQGRQAGKMGNGIPTAVSQPSTAQIVANPTTDSSVQDSSKADPYQQLSAAASGHSAFVPHVSMFDTTHEHLFYSNLSGSLKAPCVGEAQELTRQQVAKCEQGIPALQSAAAQSDAACLSSGRYAAAVVSGSEKSVSGYCSSVNET